MKKSYNIMIHFIISILMSVFIIGGLLFIINKIVLKNQKMEVDINKTYFYDHSKWFEIDNNPFNENRIDTVQVLNIQGKYVLYTDDEGNQKSEHIIKFKHNARPFYYNQKKDK